MCVTVCVCLCLNMHLLGATSPMPGIVASGSTRAALVVMNESPPPPPHQCCSAHRLAIDGACLSLLTVHTTIVTLFTSLPYLEPAIVAERFYRHHLALDLFCHLRLAGIARGHRRLLKTGLAFGQRWSTVLVSGVLPNCLAATSDEVARAYGLAFEEGGRAGVQLAAIA